MFSDTRQIAQRPSSLRSRSGRISTDGARLMSSPVTPCELPELSHVLPGEAGPTTVSNGRGVIPAVLSFDIEEYHSIEAAAGLQVSHVLQAEYRERMRRATEWILEQLADRCILGTFFILGEIARTSPGLVRQIREAGHEVASHGRNHQRIHTMTREQFQGDVRTSVDALAQATGARVLGYRAPTFSVVRQSAWTLDILADLGLLYDSSIYPVHHDRCGIPDAPRGPFLAQGYEREILELPPATLRVCGFNVPVGGGGYFRLLHSVLIRLALSCARRNPSTGATVLYCHPWEFDPDQPRLPLKTLNRFRTYVSIRRSRDRLKKICSSLHFLRAVDLASSFQDRREALPRFSPAT
jgi:polysaccharide deacetylase family protein (PEP-CTERM system associated)